MKMRILEILSCIFCGLTLTAAMDVVYMDQMCGQTKFISSSAAIRIKLTNSASYKPNMDCTFTVTGGYIGEDQLMIQFQDLFVENYCSNDWLTLYDGDDKYSSTIGRNKFCGYSTPSSIYTTTGSSLTFYFKSDNSDQKTGFDIVLTHYQTGICDSWEVNCNNGRCIDDSLRCNAYNPCGDNSDCNGGSFSTGGIATAGIATGGIAGAVVGSIVLVAIVIIVVVVVRRRRLYAYQRPVVATVQTTTVALSQGYIQPQQFQTPTVPGVYAAQTMTTYPPPPRYAY